MPNPPVGLDDIIARAVQNDAFLADLLENRSAALDNAGIVPAPGVPAVLDRIPREQIQAMVDTMRRNHAAPIKLLEQERDLIPHPSAGHTTDKPGARPLAVALGVTAAAILGGMCRPAMGQSATKNNEINACGVLKQLMVLEQTYHQETGDYAQLEYLQLRDHPEWVDALKEMVGDNNRYGYRYNLELTDTGFRATATPVGRKTAP